MGLSFPGRVKRTEECWGQSRTINDGSPRTAAKTEEKPAGVNRRAPFAIPTVKHQRPRYQSSGFGGLRRRVVKPLSSKKG
jgi:hypothetical protein